MNKTEAIVNRDAINIIGDALFRDSLTITKVAPQSSVTNKSAEAPMKCLEGFCINYFSSPVV